MFKLAHCSDVHAGYRSGSHVNSQGINLREADGYIALSRIITDIIAEEVDAAVFCGDTFHSPNPKSTETVFAQKQIRRLSDAGIKVYILAGNHDTNDIRADIAASRILDDPWRKIYSHSDPYIKHEIADGIHLHLVSHHMYSEQAETMKLIKPTPGEINIFSTHGSCIDPLLKEKLKTEQSPREIVIPDFLLNDRDWSYTLLGHIHERGFVGSRDGKTDTMNKKVYYNGSLIRRGFSDKEVKLGRGWTLWNIDSDGNFTHTSKTVEQRAQSDFEPIDATKLTPSEISDIVIERLKDTQIQGTHFDSSIAPILRQRVFNLIPSKYNSLNWNGIKQQSLHAMHWELKTFASPENIDTAEGAERALNTGALKESGDVVSLYDDWVTRTKVLDSSAKDIRELIIKQARKFVQEGQEKILEND